jgi:hypothetical protein
LVPTFGGCDLVGDWDALPERRRCVSPRSAPCRPEQQHNRSQVDQSTTTKYEIRSTSLLRHRPAASDLWVQGRSLNSRKSPVLALAGMRQRWWLSGDKRPGVQFTFVLVGDNSASNVSNTFGSSSRLGQARAVLNVELKSGSATDRVCVTGIDSRRPSADPQSSSSSKALRPHTRRRASHPRRGPPPPISKMTSPTPTRSGRGPTSADVMEKRPHACRPSLAPPLRMFGHDEDCLRQLR